jgi:SpoVK/Ycf46/Vps4 family AAA+-type ATPase
MARGRPTFFGERPPVMLNIKTSLTESVQVVYGIIQPPIWEGGNLNMFVDPEDPLKLKLAGVVKRKFETEIKEVVQSAQRLVKDHSIYRGQAIELDLNYIEKNDFDPMRDVPEFIDLSEEVELILPDSIQYVIETFVWNVIEDPEILRINKIPVKTSLLMFGPNGTGKTLTAHVTTQRGVKFNWTCLFLSKPLTSKTFLTAYRLAKLLAPALFFVEDIDSLFGVVRDAKMNEMLEGIDGITSKNAEVICIYTTNYRERLHQAFCRRVNYEVPFHNPDAKAAGRFVAMKAGVYLHPNWDQEKVGEAFAGLSPSDIANGIEMAKIKALGEIRKRDRSLTSALGEVTTEMLVSAGLVQREKNQPPGEPVDPELERLRKVEGGIESLRTFGTMRKDIEVIGKEVKAIRERFGIKV